MHDVDRTQTEYSSEFHELAGEQFEYGAELAGEFAGESGLNEVFQEAGLNETFESGAFESGYEMGAQETGYEMGMGEIMETGLNEAQEMELASELLEITNEQELEQFLGRLMKRAWRGIRRVAPGIIRGLGGALKSVAKRALPIVGGALGTAFGGPLGGMVGSRLASGAGSLFGLELEGLSNEDREYEVARRYVRFASTAARRAAMSGAPNPAALRAALAQAARQHAPGLLGRVPARHVGSHGACPSCARRRRGLWYRHGNRITLVGV